MAYTTHGHHIAGTIKGDDRPKSVSRCGGPGLCAKCAREAALTPSDIPAEQAEAENAANAGKIELGDWEPDAIQSGEPTFEQELVKLINKHSMERFSGTPDWILANFLAMVLRQFDCAVMMRADWRGESTELPALNELRGGREKEVPLVIYTNGQRNEVGIAKVKVTPGEMAVTAEITGALPIFGESLDSAYSIKTEEPKEERPSPLQEETLGAFQRYQQKGLTDNG